MQFSIARRPATSILATVTSLAPVARVLVAAVFVAAVLSGCGGAEAPIANADQGNGDSSAESTAAADTATAQDGYAGPEYTPDGQLIRPEGFHEWIFVGSNLGLGYRDGAAVPEAEALRNKSAAGEGQSFHNVYMDPAAYEHYITQKTFPEPTVFVMDKYLAQQKEPQDIVDRGYFNGDFDGFEVAVKNSDRPDGGDVPWAYYRFELDTSGQLPPSSPASPNNHCYDCHLEHGDFDNVWVQFYPVIRDVNPPPADS